MIIKLCSCSHEFQNARYGLGNRAHNLGKPKSAGNQSHICTVCGRRTEVAAPTKGKTK